MNENYTCCICGHSEDDPENMRFSDEDCFCLDHESEYIDAVTESVEWEE